MNRVINQLVSLFEMEYVPVASFSAFCCQVAVEFPFGWIVRASQAFDSHLQPLMFRLEHMNVKESRKEGNGFKLRNQNLSADKCEKERGGRKYEWKYLT